MQSSKVRWGVLSTAHIADQVVPGIRLANNSELQAVASRDLSRAQAWAKERDVPRAFGSYEELLASPEVDAVYIPLPNGLHKEWSIRAADAGKHVLCEKPLASRAADVAEIIAAAETNKVKVMEAFMYRFHPQIATLQNLLASGAIGDLKIIRATFGFKLDNPDNIRWSADLSGGSLMDVGCYCVNIARLVAGADPVAVTASAVWAESGVDASLVGTLEFPDGVLGVVDCSFQTGVAGQQGLSVSGTAGRMSLVEPFRLGYDAVSINIDTTGKENAPVTVPGANEYHLMVESFAAAVLADRPVPYTLQNSLGNARTIEALLQAARTGRRVELA